LAVTDFDLSSVRAPLVVLTGPPGVGKTTVGAALAVHLSYQFYDSDCLIQQSTGLTIPEIFELYGETRFRELESAVVEGFARSLEGKMQDKSDPLGESSGTILSTGAGLVIQPGNLQRLMSIGQIVFLSAPIYVLLARLKSGSHRPLLQAADNKAKDLPTTDVNTEIEDALLRSRLESLLEKRLPVYSQCPFTFNVGDLAVPHIVSGIADMLFGRPQA